MWWIDDRDLITDNESEPDSETDYSDMPDLVSYNEYPYNTNNTDYSDMPELISAYQLKIINNLCKIIQNTDDINQYISELETDFDYMRII